MTKQSIVKKSKPDATVSHALRQTVYSSSSSSSSAATVWAAMPTRYKSASKVYQVKFAEAGKAGRTRTVQITLASLGDAAASLLLVDLDNVDLLEGLQDLAVDGAGGVNVLGGAGTTVLGGSVDLAETADTNGLAQVDGTGDSGGADVEPVDVLRRHLLGGASLDRVNPTWMDLCQPKSFPGSTGTRSQSDIHTGDGQLALTLQESSVCVDELVRLQIKTKHHQQIFRLQRSFDPLTPAPW